MLHVKNLVYISNTYQCYQNILFSLQCNDQLFGSGRLKKNKWNKHKWKIKPKLILKLKSLTNSRFNPQNPPCSWMKHKTSDLCTRSMSAFLTTASQSGAEAAEVQDRTVDINKLVQMVSVLFCLTTVLAIIPALL